ncbi:bifunctional metallophosphatase/5'-nucleotidase [Halobacteriales archaeon QS_5_68_33]|nr:MAG: bifunctional metallophosphatase/5'-nucleotidase [Halobacteriales archaeon QS_5_68_33]
MHDDTLARGDQPRDRHDRPPLRLLAYSDLESAYDDPDRVGALSARLARRRDDRTLVVGAGDNTALGTLALLTDAGRAQALPFFEGVGPAADTFGNHDLDPGPEWAAEWADRVPATYCCANATGPGVDDVPDATVVERDGIRVGVVGVAHPETDDICGAVDAVDFGDPVPAAREALAAMDVDYRVVLAHCGAEDPRVAREVDADVVVGGHLHDRHADRCDGTVFVRTAGGGVELAEVTLGAEPEVAFHDVDPASFDPGRETTGYPTAAADGAGAAAGDAPPPVAASVARTYRERRAALGVDEVVARVADPLVRTGTERFGGESRVGNFGADAMRAATTEASGDERADGGIGGAADLALFPAGSVRTGDPLAGAVTVGDVVSVCPFGGPVIECELDGTELRDVLTEAAYPHAGDRGWVQFHVSGGRVVWTDDSELARATVGGDPLDPDRTYRVATPEYVVRIDAFAPLNRGSAVAEHSEQWEALVSHARRGGLDVACEGRIRRVSSEAVEGTANDRTDPAV